MEYNANTRVYMDVNSDYKESRSFKICPIHIRNQWCPVSYLP